MFMILFYVQVGHMFYRHAVFQVGVCGQIGRGVKDPIETVLTKYSE